MNNHYEDYYFGLVPNDKNIANFDILGKYLVKYTGTAEEIVIVPNGVKSINNTAFLGHTEIKTICLPQSVNELGAYAFASCLSLERICLGKGITIIPEGCFSGLSKLETVNLFNSIQAIDNYAFRDCVALKNLQFFMYSPRHPQMPVRTETAPELEWIGKGVFIGCPDFDEKTLKVKVHPISPPDPLQELCDPPKDIRKQAEENQANRSASVISPDKPRSLRKSTRALLIDGYIINGDTIINSRTKTEIPDCKLEELGLSNRTLNCLARAKSKIIRPGHYSIMVTDVLRLSWSQLSTIRNLGGKSEDELYTKLYSYLSEKSGIANDPGAETDVYKECLVDDFQVDGDVIRHINTGTTIKDASIELLALSKRASNCLLRSKKRITSPDHSIIMISDLLRLSWEQLNGIYSLGTGTAAEILNKLSCFLSDRVRKESIETSENSQIAPDYLVMDGTIKEITTQQAVDNVGLEELGMDAMIVQALRSNGILSLSQLIDMSCQELLHILNCKAEDLAAIKELVNSYLNAKKGASVERKPSALSIQYFDWPTKETESVLAPDYMIINGAIIHKSTLKVIPDISIFQLGFTPRSLFCLKQNYISMVSGLIGMSQYSLRKMRLLGVNTEMDIKEKLDIYLRKETERSDTIAEIKEAINASEIPAIFRGREFEGCTIEDIKTACGNPKEKVLLETLKMLIQAGKLRQTNETYYLCFPSFHNFIESQTPLLEVDERELNILRSRIAGATYEEIAKTEDLSKQRIQQIERKAFNSITSYGKRLFDEDRFAYIFENYRLGKEFFLDYLGLTSDVLYYLNQKYTSGIEAPDKALKDDHIAPNLKEALTRYVHRLQIQVDGIYIQDTRSKVEDYYLEHYCQRVQTFDQFFKNYNRFLQEAGLNNERLLISDKSKNSKRNHLMSSDKVICSGGNKFRYYSICDRDYSILLSSLNLGKYSNTELSTLKLFSSFPKLMKLYDIRDEYELHNLLKKIHAEKKNSSLVFGKMPTIRFGHFDRDEMVKSLLREKAPIRREDLAKIISQRYGFHVETICGSWFNCISDYCQNGFFSLEHMNKQV